MVKNIFNKIKVILFASILIFNGIVTPYKAFAAEVPSTDIIMTSNKNQFNVGDIVTVSIKSQSEVNIVGIQFQLKYDPTTLNMQGDIAPQGLYSCPGGSTVDKVNGILIYPLVNLNYTDKIISTTEIAKVNFKAVKAGTTDLLLSNIKAMDEKLNTVNSKDTSQLPLVIVEAPVTPVSGGYGGGSSSPVITPVATTINNINAAAIGSTTICDLTTNSVVSKDIFNAIKNQDKNITLQKDGISWTFNGKDITSAITSDIDFSLKAVSDALKIKEVAKVKEMTGKDELLIPFSFNYDGNLPGLATVKIYISKNWAGKSVTVCRYLEEKNAYETITTDAVDANGYITIKINHCSDYFVTQATNLPKIDFKAMVNGTVVIGTKAFSLEYANNPLHAEEITTAIVGGGAIYVKNFTGDWIDNLTGLQGMPK